MAQNDAIRLLLTLSRVLPTNRGSSQDPTTIASAPSADHFLHARVQDTTLGVFDVFFDSTAVKQVFAGQSKPEANGETYYDVWTSFSPLPPATLRQSQREHAEQEEGASA